MTALGQERTLAALDFMSAFGGKADVIVGKADIGGWMPVIGVRAAANTALLVLDFGRKRPWFGFYRFLRNHWTALSD